MQFHIDNRFGKCINNNKYSRDIAASPDEKDESGKENLDVKEESKPAAKPPLTDGKDKDKTVIFPKKSKSVATAPALLEQNVQNIKYKTIKKK